MFRRSFRRSLLVLLFCSLVLISTHAQRGALVQPRNLAQLVDQSALIIRGHIVSAVVQQHPELTNISTVVVSVKVERSLKGSAEGVYTFRQFIWDARDKMDAAGYRKGDELLILLNARTQYGLQSPSGLEQGRFSIRRDPAGTAIVNHGVGNSALFLQLPETAAKRGLKFSSRAQKAITGQPGTLTLEALEDMISTLAGGH